MPNQKSYLQLGMKLSIVLLLYLRFPSTLARGQHWLMTDLLPENYDKNEAPIENITTKGQLIINSTIQIISFNVYESKSNLTADLTLCHQWTDYRFNTMDYPENGSNAVVRLSKFDQFWLPVIYFRNALSANLIHSMVNIEYLEIWPKHKLLNYCSRLSASFVCKLNLANFPFDENFCNIELENLQNKNQHVIILRLIKVEIPRANSKFRISKNRIQNCEPRNSDLFKRVQHVSNDTSCAMVNLRFIRNVGYYVIRFYAPSLLMVAMTFVGFWLPADDSPGRVILNCTILTSLITTCQSAYNEVLIEYMSSLFWWLWGCQFFIYICNIQYAFALAYIHFVNDKKYARATNEESPDGFYFGKNGLYKTFGNCFGSCLSKVFGPTTDNFSDPLGRNKVDYVCRILFPLLLLLFVIVYIALTIPTWALKYSLL